MYDFGVLKKHEASKKNKHIAKKEMILGYQHILTGGG
jgi:hypothetical protein